MADYTIEGKNAKLNAFTQAYTLYLAFFDGDPEAGGTELSGGGYARSAIAPADWNTPSGGKINNANTIAMPTATGDWNGGADIPFCGMFDAPTAGTRFNQKVLVVPRKCLTGDTLEFQPGDIELEEKEPAP